MIINRPFYLNKLKKYIFSDDIKIITGLRRVGKSTLLFNLFYSYLIENDICKEENIIKISLDDVSYAKFRSPIYLINYVKEFLSNKNSLDKCFVFIDEIQYMSNTKIKQDDNTTLNISTYDVLNELRKIENLDVYITGSNSHLLSKDVLTEFRGRSKEIRVYPLSFREYVSYSLKDNTSFSFSKFQEYYYDYSLYGGMPKILSFNNDKKEKEEYLKDLFNLVYLKDIQERYKIDPTSSITINLFKYLADNISNLVSIKKITDYLTSNFDKKTSSYQINNYINSFDDAFLINKVERYSLQGKEYLSYPNKYYFTDLGIRNSLLNFSKFDVGNIMENIIYNHLVAKGYTLETGICVEKTDKTTRNKEVDFICKNIDKKCYIQSCYKIDSLEQENREKESLHLIKDNFKKIIVRNDINHSFYNDDGILNCSLYDLLMDKEYIF